MNAGICAPSSSTAAGISDAGPARRVPAAAQAFELRGVEGDLDASADPARCLRLLIPDRRQHLHDGRGVDVGGRLYAHDRLDVFLDRRPPRYG
jgi:hypothetical protein